MFKSVISGIWHCKPPCSQLCISRRCYARSHYETLNVPRNCTTKDIRNSFIKLSKKYHPDVNKSKESQARFIKIVHAYNILSKPQTRRKYDLGLSTVQAGPLPEWQSREYEHINESRNPWDDPSFWMNKRKTHPFFDDTKSYYGVDGIQKVSNAFVVFLCLLVASFGLVLQMYAIRSSFTFNREEMNRRSVEANKMLENLRKDALKNGDEVQVQLVRQRFIENRKMQKRHFDDEL